MKTQRRFHQQLEMLEVELLALGGMAEEALGAAVEALISRDPLKADDLIAGDDMLDHLYLQVEDHTLGLLALQSPVAGDLRLTSAVMHANLHLERVGDVAVNIAKIAKATVDLPGNPRITSNIDQMSAVVKPMIRASVEAFARRDLELALQVDAMDDSVDRLNRGMYKEVSACASDPLLLEWAVKMMIVSRQLERAGDHAVDIAEQVVFLLTGEFREFTDASHH